MNKKFHCVYALSYHLVLVTKWRRRVIDAKILERIREIAAMRCDEQGGRLVECDGEPDHVHMLIELPPAVALATFVNNLKTTTSRLVRRDFKSKIDRVFKKPVFWSRSYCIVSTGGAPLEIVKAYIQSQKTPD